MPRPYRETSSKRAQNRPLRLERLENRQLLAGDLEPVMDGIGVFTQSSSPRNLIEVGPLVYFVANDALGGLELWKSDGTPSGTVLVKDIRTGSGSSEPKYLTNVGGTLYFSANDGLSGFELWKSDGTEEGTVRVTDIFSDTFGSAPNQLTNVGGTLFFSANDGLSGQELWRSNGTAAGTLRVKDVSPGLVGSTLRNLTGVGGNLYFNAFLGVSGYELWKSDGTEEGTFLVKEIGAGTSGGSPQNLTNVGGVLYFTANNGLNGVELWKSDGTETGTVLVTDIRSGGQSATPSNLTNVAGTLYFSANDGVSGSELWRSDGTAIGTVRVKEIRAGAADSSLASLANVGGLLYFSANDGAIGSELWRSDGTELGTFSVGDIRSGSSGSGPQNLTNVGGTLYFVANDGLRGFELWKSDGTLAGTLRVTDKLPGSTSASPTFLTNGGGTLFFTANDGVSGAELWKSDGTEAGTALVKDLLAISNLALPRNLTGVGETLFFTANNGLEGEELWKSDGTSSGTLRVKDIRAGLSGSEPGNLIEIGGTLFFTANDGLSGVELWKSDGTVAGTVRVADIRSGAAGASPRNLANVGGTLYFAANDGSSGYELWKSDGTTAGTVRVADIRSGASGSSPRNLANVGGTLYFAANDGSSGYELWKSDGTTPGTLRVADLQVGSSNSNPQNLTNVAGTLYGIFRNFFGGYELWKSDGTALGTVRVSNGFDTFTGGNVRNLTNVGGTLYFTASTNASGTELWRSDGTDSGTFLVKDIRTGSSGSDPRFLTNVGGVLYFRANDGVGGDELWKSDGSPEGTISMKEFSTGAFDPSPDRFMNVGGTLYFRASDGGGSTELWKSDGTESGTLPVRLAGNLSLQNPDSIRTVGDRLYVAGTRPGTDQELFTIDLSEPPLLGDYDQSGAVDGLDHTFWVANFGALAGGGLQADGNGDGVVDAADYTLWRDNLGAFRDDHGTNPAAASFLSFSESVQGVIATAADSDLFRVIIQAGYAQRAILTPGTLTAGTLRVLGADGVTEVANGVGLVDWAPATSGAYYIEVSGVGGATGSYTLGLLRDDHPGAAVGSAEVTLTKGGSGTLLTPTDADWFRLRATSSLTHRASVTPGSLPGATLRVLSANGATVLASGLNSVIWNPVAFSDSYIEVTGDGGSIGTYTLALSRDDSFDTPLSASGIATPTTISTSVFHPSDADWYRVPATAGVAQRSELVLGTLPSATLRVLDADGVTELASGSSLIDWTPATTGNYYVGVSGVNGGVGTYSLNLTRDDGSNTAALAASVLVPSSTASDIFNSLDADWFRFTSTAGVPQRATVTLRTLGGVTTRVLAADGVTEIARGSTLVDWTPSSTGNYYVEVTGAEGAMGTYTLNLSQGSANNTVATATTVQVPTSITRELFNSLDANWFRFNSTAGFSQRVLLTPGTLGGARVRVLAPNGVTEIATGSTSIDWTPSSTGNYYVEVTGAEGAAGTYTLQLLSDDHSNSLSNATFISSGSNVSSILSPSDADWFRFTSTAGLIRRATLTLGTLSAASFRVLAADGVTEIVSGSGQLEWNPSQSGNYYIEVAGVDGATGSYSLALSNEDHGSTTASATTLSTTGPNAGTLFAADADWFRASVTAGFTYRTAVNLTTLAGASLRVLDNNGAVVIASGSNTVDWTQTYTGTVFIEVTGADGATGGYTLELLLDDHSGAAAGSTALGIPGTSSGTLMNALDADWFSISATAGLTHRAKVTSDNLAGAFVRVLSSNGVTVLASGLNSVDWVPAAVGNYFVEVTDAGGASGSYTLALSRDDHSDSLLGAVAVTAPASISTSIFKAGDHDWFRLTATAGFVQRADLALGTLPAGALRVLAADGVTVLASGSGAIDWILPYTGNYYIEVTGAGDSTGTYTLDLVRDDHGGSPLTATPITSPGIQLASILSPTDSDLFSLSATAGLTQRATISFGTLAGATFRVLAADGVTVLATSSSTIDWMPPITGNYFLEVRGAQGASGSYFLNFSRDEHGDQAASASVVTAPGSTPASIFTTSDADWFRLTASAGLIQRATITLGTLAAPSLRILASDGVTEITRGTTSVDWLPVTTGNYYVEVVGVGGATGTYTLGLTQDDVGGNAASARVVSSLSSFSGSLFNASDADWFRLTASAGYIQRATVTLGTLAAPSLRILASDGVTELARGTTTVDWLPTTSGNYFIEVAGVDGATGTYTLGLTQDDVGGTAANARVLSSPSSFSGGLFNASDADWFRLTATAGLIQRATITLGTLAAPSLRILASDGVTELARGTTSVDWLPVTTGTYFVEVSGVGGAMGSYTLDLSLDDHGGSAASASAVTVPGSTSASLFSISDADLFRLTATAGLIQRATITLGTLAAPSLRILTSDGLTELARGTTSVDWLPTTSGSYFVEVAGVGGATGTYTLDLSRDDHGGSASSASAVSVPGSVSANLFNANDADWFRLTATAGLTHRATLTLGTLAAPSLRILDSDGVTEVARGTTSVDWLPVTSGNYYVEVAGVGGATGTYTLGLSRDDHGGTAATASAVSAPASVSTSIFLPGDVDWFRLDATGDLFHRATLSLGTLAAGRIRVFGPDGVTQLVGDSTSVDWLPPSPGVYFIEVTGSADATGTYTLNLSRDDYGGTASTASDVSVPGSASANLFNANDTDWFRLTATAGFIQRATITLGTLGAPSLRILASDGVTEIARGTTSLDWLPATSGVYYAEVAGVGGATGTYTLGLSRDDHGNNASSASAITVPRTLTANIFSSVDEDWFRFPLQARSQVTFSANSTDQTSLGITLIGPDGVTVLASDTNGGGAVVSFWAPASGEYYGRVQGVGGSQGSYYLNFGIRPPDDHGDISSLATHITAPSSTQASINQSGDADYFALTVRAGEQYRLETLPGGSLADTTLFVYDTNGTTQLGFSDNEGVGNLSLFDWTAPADGTYFIAVRSFASPTGSYTLSVTTVSAAPALDELSSLDLAFALLASEGEDSKNLTRALRSRLAAAVGR